MTLQEIKQHMDRQEANGIGINMTDRLLYCIAETLEKLAKQNDQEVINVYRK